MLEQRQRDDWDRHSVLLCLIANANRDPKSSPFKPGTVQSVCRETQTGHDEHRPTQRHLPAGTEMIDVKFKEFFFDREPVKRAAAAAGLGFLSKSLGAVRKIARNSMKAGTTKKGKKRATKTGGPPLYHNRLLKDNIFFGLDPDKLSGVVGPMSR
jgi:hypothetical protein